MAFAAEVKTASTPSPSSFPSIAEPPATRIEVRIRSSSVRAARAKGGVPQAFGEGGGVDDIGEEDDGGIAAHIVVCQPSLDAHEFEACKDGSTIPVDRTGGVRQHEACVIDGRSEAHSVLTIRTLVACAMNSVGTGTARRR